MLLPLLLAAGCGPSEEETARAVLLVSPVPLLVALLALWLLARAWRQLDERVEHAWRPGLVGLALVTLLAPLALVSVPYDPPGGLFASTTSGPWGVVEWAPHALWFHGTSYLSLVLVTWRVWLRVRPRTASTWAFLPPLVVSLAPVPQLAGGGWNPPWPHVSSHVWAEVGISLWIYPGWAGAITTPLLLLLVIELVVRRRLARVRSRVDLVSSADAAMEMNQR